LMTSCSLVGRSTGSRDTGGAICHETDSHRNCGEDRVFFSLTFRR
jgi:hypothetical protein